MSGTRRRQFLKLAAVGGSGLLLGVQLSACGERQEQPPYAYQPGDFTPDAFLHITPANEVRFYLPRDEMGQGICMGLATLIAEELDLHPGRIELHFAPVDEAYNNPDYRMQGTGGSNSLAVHYLPLRQSAANARALLIQAAAKRHGVSPAALDTRDGSLLHGTEVLGPYGDYAGAAAALSLSAQAPLKLRQQFRYIGSEIPRIDALAKATGTAQFGIDVELPGLQRAVVLRCPVAGGSPRRVDAQAALAMPGVTAVLEIHSGVAVVAASYWQASRAVDVLKVDWDLPSLAGVSSQRVRADYRAALDNETGRVAEQRGDVDTALGEAALQHSADYFTPFLAHATLEPMNATARIADGQCEVWAGCQSPQLARGLAAHYSEVPVERVTVHNQFMGGGFGRRMMHGHVAEAAQLAALTGLPIQVVWSREQDIRNGYYRPASLVRLQAGLDGRGRVIAWRAQRVGANIMPGLTGEAMVGMAPALPRRLARWVTELSHRAHGTLLVDAASVEGLHEDYDWPHLELRHVTVDHGLPTAYWRSVGHSFTAFAKEVMMDELAARAGLSATEFRLRNSAGNPRLQGVIRRAAEVLAQGPSAPGRALGMAAHTSFGTAVAQVAEVSLEAGQIRVHRVTCAVDCGQVVNPAIVRDQMAGAIIFGLSAALYGRIDLEDGVVQQSNFHDYPLLRIDQAPEIEVQIVASGAHPSGVGEPGLPPIAPALANAVYGACGQRLRSLPLRPA
jgi:isoquinoline 1-oxidoreductase beta subunit